MSTHAAPGTRISLPRLRAMRGSGEKIACLTAYDASFARAADAAGAEVILVGDSLGMVVQGHDSTIPVSMDDMLYHTRAAARGITQALLMGDLPYMAYAWPQQAVGNAARLMQAGAQIVKLEGCAVQAEIVHALTARGIPVCAHLGLQPQAVHKIGGYKVQGRGQLAALSMVEDAVALEQAGADLLLLECVPRLLAAEIRAAVGVPVIGIGAGSACDGQILVLHDVLGLTPLPPRFVRNFMTGQTSIQEALAAYVRAVKNGAFPALEHSFD
jgi:3-methyl-2-oxobutanoate hydroxymethyltransferase